MELQGILEVCPEKSELWLTTFQEKDGLTNEECHDLHDVLHCLDNKKVKIVIEYIDN